MTDEIRVLYGDWDFVRVEFEARPFHNPIIYRVEGLGDKPRYTNNEDAWIATHGVEGTFSYEFLGDVSHPEQWAGCQCRLMVNSLGSMFRFEHEKKGYLGDGWYSNRSVLLRLYIKPSIARDILDKIYFFDKTDNGGHGFRCHLVNLKIG